MTDARLDVATTPATVDDRDDQWWIDYYTPIHPCYCREIDGHHNLADTHPNDR